MTPAGILAADPTRMRLLAAVARLDLREAAIGAGFVRNAVWDWLHGRPAAPPDTDIDVVWFSEHDCCSRTDHAIETSLRSAEPDFDWSVKNQARMYIRNTDAPYRSLDAALACWPETATAIAMRLTAGRIETVSPYGTADLMQLLLRPTPAFSGDRRALFMARVEAKGWLTRWPNLRLAGAVDQAG